MGGFPVDAKRSPLNRRQHTAVRLGFLGIVGVVVAVTALVEKAQGLGPIAGVAAAVGLYLLWGLVGLDLRMLFESHERYVRRYRKRQEEAQLEGAAEFLAEGGGGSSTKHGGDNRGDALTP